MQPDAEKVSLTRQWMAKAERDLQRHARDVIDLVKTRLPQHVRP